MRDDGGCVFAPDPQRPIGAEPALWLPELSPATLIVESAPDGFGNLAELEPTQFGTVVADIADAEGRELVVVDGPSELHIRLQGRHPDRGPAFLVPLDLISFELRLDVLQRLARRLRGQRVALLPDALRLSLRQRRRLIQLLHAFDIHEAGGGPRDIAGVVLRSEQAGFPSTEWKDSHARRTANRLIHDSEALVRKGYLKLLRGG